MTIAVANAQVERRAPIAATPEGEPDVLVRRTLADISWVANTGVAAASRHELRRRLVLDEWPAHLARVIVSLIRIQGTPSTVTCIRLSTVRPSGCRYSHCSMYTAG